MDHGEGVRVALHLDLVALSLGPERPGRVEVLLTHQPVHRHPYDDPLADLRLPREPARRDLTGLDRSDRRLLDPGRGDGDLLRRHDLRLGEPEGASAGFARAAAGSRRSRPIS